MSKVQLILTHQCFELRDKALKLRREAKEKEDEIAKDIELTRLKTEDARSLREQATAHENAATILEKVAKNDMLREHLHGV